MGEFIFSVCLGGIILLGMVFCLDFMNSVITDSAIEKRAAQTDMAQYNSTTGEFQYLNDDLKFIIEGE